MKRVYLSAVLSASFIAGCASWQQIDQTLKRSEEQAAQASQIAAAMRAQQAVPVRRAVVFSDTPMVAQQPLTLTQHKPIEPLNCTLTFAPAMPLDLLEFGQMVTKLCGFPVRVTADALANIKGQTALAAPSSNAARQDWPSAAGLPPLPETGKAIYATTQGGSQLISSIKWNAKPVEGLLDLVTARFGLSWRKVGSGVSIFYLDTKTFNFYAIPSTTEMQSVVQSGTSITAGLSSGGGEAGGGGLSGGMGSNQTTAVALKTSIADDLAKNVQSMLTPSVGRMALSAATGTLTVTDTPEVLTRVENYLQNQNRNLTQQVLLNVKVLAVTLTDKNSLGIDWNLVYQALTHQFGFSFKSVSEAVPNASLGAISILDSTTGRAGQFSGTHLIVQALSQQGRISMMTSPSVTTLNLQPVPVQVARQISYLASVQTTHTAQVGVTTALTPATITTGFNMNLLPYVMPDRQLLLQYSINLSALQRLRSVSSGTHTIEIPEIENRIFSQKVRLKSGETLVLSGFEQSTEGGVKSGVEEKGSLLLGGTLAADQRREVVVVLITPVVLD